MSFCCGTSCSAVLCSALPGLRLLALSASSGCPAEHLHSAPQPRWMCVYLCLVLCVSPLFCGPKCLSLHLQSCLFPHSLSFLPSHALCLFFDACEGTTVVLPLLPTGPYAAASTFLPRCTPVLSPPCQQSSPPQYIQTKLNWQNACFSPNYLYLQNLIF